MVAPLSREELNLKRLIQEVLVRNQVLGTKSEREWNIYCSRRILRDFVHMMRESKKVARAEKPAPEKPAPARGPGKQAPRSQKAAPSRRRT